MTSYADNTNTSWPSQARQERPVDLNTQPGVSMRRIHIYGVELGSPEAELHEAAGLGPLTSEAIYNPATGKLDQIDASAVSLFSNQAPHIAGPSENSSPATG